MGTDIQMNLSAKLTSLRKQKGLTQMDLAEKLNVSRQAISRWEVGTAVPSTDNLKVLSELYGVTVDYLLNDDTVPISEEREPISVNESHKPKTRKFMMLLLFAVDAIVVAIIASILTIVSIQNKDQNQVVPIEDLIVVEEDDWTTYTFSFDKFP